MSAQHSETAGEVSSEAAIAGLQRRILDLEASEARALGRCEGLEGVLESVRRELAQVKQERDDVRSAIEAMKHGRNFSYSRMIEAEREMDLMRVELETVRGELAQVKQDRNTACEYVAEVEGQRDGLRGRVEVLEGVLRDAREQLEANAMELVGHTNYDPVIEAVRKALEALNPI